MLQIIGVGYQPVTGGKRITGGFREIFRPGALGVMGKTSAAILPDVEGTDRLSLGIQLKDAVHLSGDADGAYIRKGCRQLLHKGDGCL